MSRLFVSLLGPPGIFWEDEPVAEADQLAWYKALVFMFAGNAFFERLFIVEGHATWPSGSVMMTVPSHH